MKKDSDETLVPNYVNKKCQDCGQTFEVRVDVQHELYGRFCPQCFLRNVATHMDGTLRLKDEEEKIQDLSYKDELQDITHRGKIRV